MDIKKWLQQTGMKVEECRFLKPPPPPYMVFFQDQKNRGDDSGKGILESDIRIELYSDRVSDDAEKSVETLIKAIGVDYEKDRTWIKSEGFFQTMYDFQLIEKTEVK